MPHHTKQEKENALASLRERIKPGATIYTKVNHVARSGMSRSISCYIMEDNTPQNIDWQVSVITGNSIDQKSEGVRVGGCGMDMGFHLVSSLSYYLYPQGFTCIGDKCPSNDHSNGDHDYTPHTHKSGDYAIRQRWM